MKPSLILRTSAPPILAIALAYSVYILLRGHNAPGGGFIGGLVAGVGLLFYAIARGREAALRALRIRPTALCGLGMLMALGSGLPALLGPQPYLTHAWYTLNFFGLSLPLGTALLFDTGVYCAVVGTICAIFMNLIQRPS